MTDPTDATVLIVDDEEELVRLYRAFLDGEYDVRTATSGTEALEKVDGTVDVALLDRRMPGMTGDEVLAEFRERGLDCMVAMLTAVEPGVDIVEMPFDDYKVKPVDRSDLCGLVDVLLERVAYDEQSQEFFRLASKKAALEIAGEDETEEYDRLVARLDEVREDIDTALDRVGAEAAFADLSGSKV